MACAPYLVEHLARAKRHTQAARGSIVNFLDATTHEVIARLTREEQEAMRPAVDLLLGRVFDLQQMIEHHQDLIVASLRSSQAKESACGSL